ncbi:hypothetical protein [Nocardia callitridis]|uniref:Uncharacterized protein n=1 Tax=Nocardia callitridis TaxID=648753 RepID=A0ABP9JYR0_9NOCA
MSYEHVLLPSGAATSPAEADAYLSTQQGVPESATVAAIAAELNRRDEQTPDEDTFLAAAPVGGAQTGAALVVSSPYDAIGFVRALLFELATPRDYALYDPQLAWLIDPAGHVEVEVTHGGAGEFPYITKTLAQQWVSALSDPEPYIIASRDDHEYIQAYRMGEDEFTVEYRDGSPEKHFATALDTAATAEVIWAWANNDTAHIGSLPWTRVKF